MEEVDGEELVKKFAEEMERMLGRKMKSVKRLAEAAEDADLYHEFNATLEFDYYNSMLINSVDKDGNAIELGGEFPLEENEHFNKLQVNTLQSDIQVPTNVYNKGQLAVVHLAMVSQRYPDRVGLAPYLVHLAMVSQRYPDRVGLAPCLVHLAMVSQRYPDRVGLAPCMVQRYPDRVGLGSLSGSTLSRQGWVRLPVWFNVIQTGLG
ncbi:voltage-dependent calcium channel subunit alpha-2/delta-4-like [Oncorhynchus kisutch]|uniref:voltage-dependent calcium channel subunit alpha-2/delta-4-like n=1 Tax=Oncorhynchus kisutch TaxID=8019 RepID=UPI0012DDEF51|nr:voltage-dependent calcium channel subunit alpha-2/delta-4-like [Oncorhynchus kisutch]